MPSHAVFSHATAARLHDFPLPPRHTHGGVFDVTVPRGHRALHGKGMRGHQAMIEFNDWDDRAGVSATTPLRTFCDLAVVLTLPELVAVGDALIRRNGGLHTRADVVKAVAEHPARRHARRLLRAVELLDEDAESPKESELRVIIIEAGLPAPKCNVSVFDRRGVFVARVDLAYRDKKIAIEYEGDHHRDKHQWRADLKRRRRLEALGWVYLSVTQTDLDDARDLIADVRAALAR